MGHITRPLELDSITTRPEVAQSSNQSSPSEILKCRRILSCASKPWHDCVQAVVNLLPATYAEQWLQCLEQLLHGDGPLPISWRMYIAILALCQDELTWTVKALTFEFMAWEGEKKWLFGVRFAPSKIRALVQLNNTLAHRPWLVTPRHISELTKGDESWSLSELCQALCILTHFHALSSFLHACLPKQPPRPTSSPLPCNSLPLTPTKTPTTPHPSSLPPNVFRHLQSDLIFSNTDADSALKLDEGELFCETQPKGAAPPTSTPTLSPIGVQPVFNSSPITDPKATSVIAGAKREIQTSPQPSKQSKNEGSSSRRVSFEDQIAFSWKGYQHLSSESTYQYEDFPTSANNSILRIREYNWQDHGYCLVNRLLNDMGDILDNRFAAITTIPQDTVSPSVRQALWNYVQSLYGIHHDDYDYTEMHKILGSPMEAFAKRSACSPHSLQDNIPSTLSANTSPHPIKVVPLAIVIMDAKLQSELMFALRAVVPHQC